MSRLNNLQTISVIAILKYCNKFLLVQRNLNDNIFPGKWQNVGGQVEAGENIESALRREMKEEVGITILDKIKPKFIVSYSWKKSQYENFRLGIVFLILFSKKPNVKINSELKNYKWLTYDETLMLDTIGKGSLTGTIGQLRAVSRQLYKKT